MTSSNALSLVHSLVARFRSQDSSEAPTITALGADGSDRLFFRIISPGQDSLIAMVPGQSHPGWRAESQSSLLIGRHLASWNIPVPAILGHDEASGAILFEDLGDVHLQACLRDPDVTSQEILALYREAMDILFQMQTTAVAGFDASWCWDTPHYDKKLMIERESFYFYDFFVKGLARIAVDEGRLLREFQELARRAAQEPAHFLLHRDYQSRNLMVHQGRLRVIDYQGMRFGPLGYDVAALLMDPYAALDASLREELLGHYATTVAQAGVMTAEAFRIGYYYLFLQRNLQIIGAYANLGYRKGKVFFRQFLRPALLLLHEHLEKEPGAAFPELIKTVGRSLALPDFES